MTRPVLFLPEAEADLLEGQAWYDARAIGLGDRFFAAVDVVVRRIGAAPHQFPEVHGRTHRALVRHFPYAIFFRVESDGVYIVACMHTSRNPQRWRSRATVHSAIGS